MTPNQNVETWEIHNRINLFILDAIAPQSLSDTSPAKGRTVGELFAHLHNVRLMWLKVAAPDLLDKLKKIEKADAGKKDLLRKSLADSGDAIAALFEKQSGSRRQSKRIQTSWGGLHGLFDFSRVSSSRADRSAAETVRSPAGQ